MFLGFSADSSRYKLQPGHSLRSIVSLFRAWAYIATSKSVKVHIFIISQHALRARRHLMRLLSPCSRWINRPVFLSLLSSFMYSLVFLSSGVHILVHSKRKETTCFLKTHISLLDSLDKRLLVCAGAFKIFAGSRRKRVCDILESGLLNLESSIN